jgi:hypothetical protein
MRGSMPRAGAALRESYIPVVGHPTVVIGEVAERRTILADSNHDDR